MDREVLALTVHEVERLLSRLTHTDPTLQEILGRVRDRDLDPLSAVGTILRDVLGAPPG